MVFGSSVVGHLVAATCYRRLRPDDGIGLRAGSDCIRRDFRLFAFYGDRGYSNLRCPYSEVRWAYVGMAVLKTCLVCFKLVSAAPLLPTF